MSSLSADNHKRLGQVINGFGARYAAAGRTASGPTSAEIEAVARAIHAADQTHCTEKWSEVRSIYRTMAEAALQTMADLSGGAA